VPESSRGRDDQGIAASRGVAGLDPHARHTLSDFPFHTVCATSGFYLAQGTRKAGPPTAVQRPRDQREAETSSIFANAP
jgi:hypothetical protein